MDAKRPKEDVEHSLFVKVLQITQPPATKISAATVGQFLEDEVARITRASPAKGLEEAIQFLARGWRRSEEGGVVPSTWPSIPALQEALLTTALTQLIAAPSDDKVRALSVVLESPMPGRLLNELLTAAAEDEGVPARLLIGIARPLKDRHLNDPMGPQFAKLLRVLRASKKYPVALVTSPCLEEIWRPVFEPKFIWRNRKKEVIAKQRPGWVMQSRSLLGWALSPAALDGATFGPEKAHFSEVGSQEWGDLQLARATRQRIDGLQRGTRLKLTSVQTQAAELVDIMLRAGDEPRYAVLTWLGGLAAAAEPRGKQGYVVPEGFNFWPQQGQHIMDVMSHDQTPAFEKNLKNLLLLQALHAKLHGFPTSGASLNCMTLLLHLIKPIKAEQANSFSPFYPMRTDVEDIMGNWDKESRFGEKEQLEAAAEVAKNDSAFTVACNDKSLFKSQVFWMATKGVGTLLLPVVKEAFHTFQNIANVFYEKDRTQADVAWREYLLSEASLRDPAFLERLGHFVDLTFRFLTHVAAGGQQALPPPAPTSAWHALPSTVLENVLELCDLYRDRTRRETSSIPTGLFVHLDPKPVMTMLLIVMASDDHVRDPSLRGRSVKLLHRLCISFPAWQEMLNQPPLVQHIIPCLINVFVAVEKAIMSYYDLEYRYKYELRGPIMDLLDQTLKHSDHRKILDTFVRGPGNDRFLKMLTQLINDSNSQIEEALRTVKEFHEQKNAASSTPPAAPPAGQGPGGQHDEQVLADDQTGEGEDVYRRSRKNYKEHAKKYFGLASRTWKTLWLLCQHCAPVIVEGRTSLEQLLHTSLDAQLHFLVGPEMKSIKSSPQEYDELGFSPKDMVRQIAEIYLFLARFNRDEVCRIVAKDERYYSTATFSKAVSFVKKYGLLAGSTLAEFEGLAKDLADRVSQQRAAFDEADIPAEFLCEMMADIMSDPVQFPQSKKIVDRWVAVRQIMGTDRDPYANTHVTVEQLIPLTDMKERIHRFAKENGIALEGGNMFD